MSSKKVEVQYAADLPSSKYGSAFPVNFSKKIIKEENDPRNALFNLNNTYKVFYLEYL